MLSLSEETTIDAPPQTVFDVLADFASYARWNPWVVEAVGSAVEGERVRVKARLGARTMQVDHRVLVVRPGWELRWCDLGWFTHLARGERARLLEPLPGGGVKYRVELRVTGIASSLTERLFGEALVAGIHGETAALKQRAEAIARLIANGRHASVDRS